MKTPSQLVFALASAALGLTGCKDSLPSAASAVEDPPAMTATIEEPPVLDLIDAAEVAKRDLSLAAARVDLARAKWNLAVTKKDESGQAEASLQRESALAGQQDSNLAYLASLSVLRRYEGTEFEADQVRRFFKRRGLADQIQSLITALQDARSAGDYVATPDLESQLRDATERHELMLIQWRKTRSGGWREHAAAVAGR